AAGGSGELARIELIVGIEGSLDASQFGIERVTKEGRGVLAAITAPMFAPEDTAVFLDEGDYFVTDPAEHFLIARISHVESRTNMQTPDVDMPEHAVAQAATVEQRSEFADIVGETFGRDGSVLHER